MSISTVENWAFFNPEHFCFFLSSTDFALQYISFPQIFSMTNIFFLQSFLASISLQGFYFFLVYISPIASLFFTSFFSNIYFLQLVPRISSFLLWFFFPFSIICLRNSCQQYLSYGDSFSLKSIFRSLCPIQNATYYPFCRRFSTYCSC